MIYNIFINPLRSGYICGLVYASRSGIPSGKLTVCYWKWPFIVDVPSYKMVIFHSYVSLPEGNHKPYQWPCHDLSTSIDLLRWLWVFSTMAAKRPHSKPKSLDDAPAKNSTRETARFGDGCETSSTGYYHGFNVDISRHEHLRTSMKYNEIVEVSRWCCVVWAPCCVCHLTSSHAKFCLSCQRQQRILLNLQDG